MLDYEIYEEEFEFFANYNPDDDIFDFDSESLENPYWWEL